MTDDTVNARLLLALNREGTASFDLRPAVARFLNDKARREKVPSLSVYKKLAFVSKLFRSCGVKYGGALAQAAASGASGNSQRGTGHTSANGGTGHTSANGEGALA